MAEAFVSPSEEFFYINPNAEEKSSSEKKDKVLIDEKDERFQIFSRRNSFVGDIYATQEEKNLMIQAEIDFVDEQESKSEKSEESEEDSLEDAVTLLEIYKKYGYENEDEGNSEFIKNEENGCRFILIEAKINTFTNKDTVLFMEGDQTLLFNEKVDAILWECPVSKYYQPILIKENKYFVSFLTKTIDEKLMKMLACEKDHNMVIGNLFGLTNFFDDRIMYPLKHVNYNLFKQIRNRKYMQIIKAKVESDYLKIKISTEKPKEINFDLADSFKLKFEFEIITKKI